MARLEAVDGRWFELTPVGYQYPGNRLSVWDANWLDVRFAAGFREPIAPQVGPRAWTWSLNELVGWCRSAANGRHAADSWFALSEPVLQLWTKGLSGGRIVIRVDVSNEFGRRPIQFGNVRARLTVEQARLLRFADELQKEMRAFPVIDLPPLDVGV